MNGIDRLREFVATNGTGMAFDLLFAVCWVGLVGILFEFVFRGGPQWAYYLMMLAGIPAYFGFRWSVEQATQPAPDP